ncbi:MAG: bacteriohemerythrin [Desulfobacteraceae bacterium]|jgi:hemerythrin-like metal-binding protein
MAYMNWTDKLSVGIEEIDSQHKKLIQMINEFYDGVISDDKIAMGRLLTSLIDYTISHFATEEKYMKLFNYPGAATHIEEHRSFTDKVSDIKKRFGSGELVLSLEITNFVKVWIIKHVLGIDKMYSQCFISNGLK